MLTEAEHGLQHTSPERQGIASSDLLQFVEALESQIDELHSIMLIRHGNVVAEGWWTPYKREYPHMMYSLSKSFTSTAVGLAIGEGRFSIDDPVLSFFPDEAPAEVSEFLAVMTVRHLLSMSTGHAVDTWSFLFNYPEANWVKNFLEVPVQHAPGTHFLYNTGATYMLSAIVQKTTGMTLIEYLTPRLFEPLGIKDASWEESPQGINLGGTGLSIKTDDIARFGQLYLQKGLWQGQQILSEAWVEEASNFQVSNGDNPESDWTQGYGYQFWRCRHDAYRGDGAFGQYCIVMPKQDAVLAITGGIDVFDMQPPLNLVWEMLLPAMHEEALPDDPIAHEVLIEKLSHLNILPVSGERSSQLSSQVSGRTYHVEANSLNIETLSLNFTESGCMVTIQTAAGTETISCGYDVWLLGQTSLFNIDYTRVAASGAWTAENTFTMVVRLYETPFYHTLAYQFDGAALKVEARINVSFESLKPLLLTAHLI